MCMHNKRVGLMVQNWSFDQKWLRKFKTIIIDYTKHRTPDPFMNWFRQKDSEGFFADDFERALAIFIDARFDQRTTARALVWKIPSLSHVGETAIRL